MLRKSISVLDDLHLNLQQLDYLSGTFATLLLYQEPYEIKKEQNSLWFESRVQVIQKTDFSH